MVRKKQTRPERSIKILNTVGSAEELPKNSKDDEILDGHCKVVVETNRFVEIDRSYWALDKHLDIAEVIVTDPRVREGLLGCSLTEDCSRDSRFSVRFRLPNVEKFSERIRLGYWPVISAENILLELLDTNRMDENEKEAVVFSGIFDGPNDGVSGLVHLVSQNMLMVRPVKEVRVLEAALTLTMRVEILKNAFDACESLLENTRQPWRRSMISVMAWLRPEVTTQETIYGIDKLETTGVDIQTDTDVDHIEPTRKTRFNAAGFYEAIKPSKKAPMLEDKLPDLLPELRPYQRRAAYWMVKREREISRDSGEMYHNEFLRPLCIPVNFLHTDSRMFYNPFSGSVSLHPESFSPYVSGGILADEMGLGKTVELLACIFAHRKSVSEGITMSENLPEAGEGQRIKRLKIERVECICGAVTESPKYKGLWVQCDMCDAWQHADCVGYSPERKSSDSEEISKERGHKRLRSSRAPKHLKKKCATNIVEMDGNHICQLCSELIHNSHAAVNTGATLIVCPSPILHQWHAEIIRHTRPGSLKICVYQGVKNASLSSTTSLNISELVSADVVLTTYDVLKEDLSHDSDRSEGGHRLMRFDKRYPVIPTLLTKIFWWRVCLDEAQMVESNTAAATEMALRLHAKYHWCITGTPIQRKLDDLYGLLRFLNTSPFEVRRWWLEVIRDPYERREAGAMEFAHKFFKQIMWRSLKVHVADELQLPEQEECVSWLFLSPIEAHFYEKQHETCSSYALELIKFFNEVKHKKNSQGSHSHDASSDIMLTHVEASKLFHSLLKLRQACCHPQVGSSGLRSLQHSPMTMEEVLGVLVSKSKLEGEDALRKSVLALNALAGIAIINGDISQAISLYREALTLAEEHWPDFQLDPLMNMHIHLNLAEIFADSADSLDQIQSMECQFAEYIEERALKLSRFDCDKRSTKRQIKSNENSSCATSKGHQEHQGKEFTSDPQVVDSNRNEGVACDANPLPKLKAHFRMAYEILKQKYLAAHLSKLSQAQQEFRNSYVQVCNALDGRKNKCASWWLEALCHVENSKESSKKFISKVDNTLFGDLSSSEYTRNASRFRSISALKSFIKIGLDSLESSRQVLIERILEIDKTIEAPRDEEFSRVRYCRNCNNGNGPICVRCELDSLFMVYEAQLFLCVKEGKGQDIVLTAEEAISLQKKKSVLNHFNMSLAHPNNDSSSPAIGTEENEMQRGVGTAIKVTKSPSELENILRVLNNFSKAWLGKDSMSEATKHLFLFEDMRKEYFPARSLAFAQEWILNAYDELKMGTSRLRLRETDDDTSNDALSREELVANSIQQTSDKFVALSSLSRVKGQFRYLKGLVSKQQSNMENSYVDDTDNSASTSHTRELDESTGNALGEVCPVCHENLSDQKMVFQCGHVTCCKCLFAMTKNRSFSHKENQNTWLMCPTCRQHTDFRNIACVDDRLYKASNPSIPNTFQDHENPEASILVQGSYGTKIEAVTRRILWIKFTDPVAKVLVFSSWNDVLDVLEHALSANSVSYIRMKGGRKSHVAIAQFKGHKDSEKTNGEKCDKRPESKSFQVMLLLIQHGANGLNLLEAKHVILVEPLLNPAAEAQAINRVHRIGQDKMTLVHRFIVKDSVEESIYKLNKNKTTDRFICGNTKNQDQSFLTLKDVESLFSSTMPLEQNTPSESLMHLPPAVAAVHAAERRRVETLS